MSFFLAIQQVPKMAELCTPQCRHDACEEVFERVHVMPRVAGGTRVEWSLFSDFTDPAPHTFQLEVGATGSNLSDDWQAVGLPAEDAFFLVDDTQRVYGKTQWTHYRVKLTTSEGVYYSQPQDTSGHLGRRDWRIAREVLRRELLMLRKYTGRRGYLLKMRYTGTPCPRCLDYQTDEVRDQDCPVCLGTGKISGYYAPIPCVYAAVHPISGEDHLDPAQARGMVNDVHTKGRMLAVPQMLHRDVWIDRDSDSRWKIHRVENICEIRGVALVCEVDLRLIPFSDPLYQLAMPDQVPEDVYL